MNKVLKSVLIFGAGAGVGAISYKSFLAVSVAHCIEKDGKDMAFRFGDNPPEVWRVLFTDNGNVGYVYKKGSIKEDVKEEDESDEDFFDKAFEDHSTEPDGK